MTKNSNDSATVENYPLYRIGEAARMTGVSRETLRIWERKGLITSRRSTGSYRLYSREDIARMADVKRWRLQGINLAGIESLCAANGSQVLPSDDASARTGGQYIGRKLRQLRLSGHLSLSEVSRRAGLSASFLSLVERGLARPSAVSLDSLCAALGTTAVDLLGQAPAGGAECVRVDHRRSLPSLDPGIKIEQLASLDSALDCEMFTLAPGKSSDQSYVHHGEEFIFVLSGQLQITLDHANTYTLSPGDTMCFESMRPHSWRNAGSSEVTALWINTNANPSGSA